MDKTIIIAAVIAVVAILAVTLILNPFSGSTTTTEEPEPAVTKPQEKPKEPEGPKQPPVNPNAEAEDATFGKMVTEVQGNCILYKHVASDTFKCFGSAGNFTTMVTNEYRQAESETYFCKPMPTGCVLYEKAPFEL